MSEITKLAIVGISKAGKTSIYRRCFENHSLKDIEKTPPTIMIAQNLVNVGHISKGISVWDFGGQTSFRDAYLANPSYFAESKIILFVIDIMSEGDFSEEKQYFGSILQIFQDLKKNQNIELPKMYIFLHKCDPKKRNELNQRIAKCLIEMTSLFNKDIPFFMTSIYDDSACRSLNNILFFSLPEEVMGQIFSKEFFEDIRNALEKNVKGKSTVEITEVSKVFGDLMGRKLYDLWLNSPIKKTIKKGATVNFSKNIEAIYKEHQKYFKIRCPYLTEKKSCSEEDCLIVHGFIAGMLTSLNLSQRSMKIEKVKEQDICYFIF